MDLNKCDIEQLVNICQCYPVWSGDLISKDSRTKLVECGLVKAREGNGATGVSDGERLGGWVPTEEGLRVYMALPEVKA